MEIRTKEHLQQLESQLPGEYYAKLSNWWRRAQKPDQVYVIVYSDISDLCAQVDAHEQKARKRASQRNKRESGRRCSSTEQQCIDVIHTLADVRGVSVTDVIANLQGEIDAQRERAASEAEKEAAEAAEKIRLFRAEHLDLFAEWDILTKQKERASERVQSLSLRRTRTRAKK